MLKKYEMFFQRIKVFKEKQDAQKQRGLNDYNMVNVVRSETAEVGMHSNVIYSLIDPHGSHYQGNLFLQHFISDVLAINDFGTDITVKAEESTHGENRRIDFTIKSEKYYIGIEMKVNANDLDNQIGHYYSDLCKKAKSNKINEENVIVYYLTKNGKEASSYSYGEYKDYRKISFEEHILKWIDSCQKEVRNITNLNEAFSNYRSIVEKITNKYEGKVMQLKDELLKDKELYVLAEEVSRAFEEAKREKTEEKKSVGFDKICTLLDEKGIEYKKLKEKAISIQKTFHIKIISLENNYLFQVTDINKPFETIDKIEKESILPQLQNIDTSFKSSYSKVFGAMEIPYKDIDKERIIKIINEIFVLKNS